MPEMGEELEGGSAATEDAQAASNATPPEGESPAAGVDAGGEAAPDAGTAAPESTGATQALTGDEDDAAIEAHFKGLVGSEMTEARAEQLARLSKANRDHRREMDAAEKRAASADGFADVVTNARNRYIAQQPGSAAIFQRLADDPVAQLQFMSDPKFRDERVDDLLGPEEVEGFNINDPTHKLLLELQKKVGELTQEREAAREAAEQQANQAAYNKELDAAVGSLGLSDDASKAHARVLLTGLYVDAALKQPDVALSELTPELTKMMKAITVAASSEAEKQADEAKPVVPTAAKAAPSAAAEEEDEYETAAEREDRIAAKNAMQPQG